MAGSCTGMKCSLCPIVASQKRAGHCPIWNLVSRSSEQFKIFIYQGLVMGWHTIAMLEQEKSSGFTHKDHQYASNCQLSV